MTNWNTVLVVAVSIATAGCAGGRATPTPAGDRSAAERQVTLIWAWDSCLKSVDGLVAVDLVRRHFAADPRVEVTTVFLERAEPERIESAMAKRGVRLPWRADPDCDLCAQMPERFWEELRAVLRANGVPEQDLATVGNMLSVPTVLIVDSRGRKFAFDGWPLGMDDAGFAQALIEEVDKALAGDMGGLRRPDLPWTDLSQAELEEVLSRARSQLSRWQQMEPSEIEAVINALRARATP